MPISQLPFVRFLPNPKGFGFSRSLFYSVLGVRVGHDERQEFAILLVREMPCRIVDIQHLGGQFAASNESLAKFVGRHRFPSFD